MYGVRGLTARARPSKHQRTDPGGGCFFEPDGSRHRWIQGKIAGQAQDLILCIGDWRQNQHECQQDIDAVHQCSSQLRQGLMNRLTLRGWRCNCSRDSGHLLAAGASCANLCLQLASDFSGLRERGTGLLESGGSGRGAAWLARLLGVQEVPGSNPGGPTNLESRAYSTFVNTAL